MMLSCSIRPESGNSIIIGGKSEPWINMCKDTLINSDPLRARAAEPNPAHIALARFSLPQYRNNISPDSTFTLITQNVDGLSQRALETIASESAPEVPVPDSDPQHPPLLEMHGRLFDLKCSDKSCRHTEPNLDSPICAALGGTEILVEAGVIEPNIAETDLPHCSQCNALARPGVVWFGEIPMYQKVIDKLVKEADLCLVVGTSSTVSLIFSFQHDDLSFTRTQVYPAARYASKVRAYGGKVAVFNLDHSHGDDKADFLFLGPCEETLPQALGLVDLVDTATQN